MEYQYVATTPKGKIKKGTIEASSKKSVVKRLQQQKLIIMSIDEGELELKTLSAKKLGGNISFGRVPMLDKIIFARNLSVMLRAGLSLTESLDAILEQASSKKMQEVSIGVLKDVSNGQTLADSMKRYPKIFSSLVIGMIRVGEVSGTLDQNLDYVATVLEKDYELRRKVKSAMLYPAIVLSATVILGIILSIFILPKLVRMFDTFRLELPLTTKIFLNIATFLVNYGIFVLIFLAGLAVMVRVLMKWSKTKPFFHNLYLSLPIIKKLIRNVNLARLARVMTILLKSGVTINESLSIAASVVGNVHYQRELSSSLERIQQGKSLASSLTNTRYVPKMASRMIGEGEKTGNLDESFLYLADFYEKELDNTTKNLATVLEPILLVVIGIVLGLLAVAIISPIYQFTGQLQG